MLVISTLANNAPIPSRRGHAHGHAEKEEDMQYQDIKRGVGRPPKGETICRVTVRLDEDYYNKVARKMKLERRATMADTVRVILIEYFDARKEG